jgi:hypothetical protein
MGWKEVSRRLMFGSETPLKALGGEFWIIPKKLSVQAADELAEISRSIYLTGDVEKTKKFREFVKQNEAEGKNLDDVIKEMDPLDLMRIIPQHDKEHRARMYEIVMLHGVGGHNLMDDNGKLIHEGKLLDPKTVKEILEEAAPLAEEIFLIVQDFNASLRKGSGPTSPMSLNGSSKEPSTIPEPNSPTEGIQQDS